MKKISFKYSMVIAAVAAMTFASCGKEEEAFIVPNPDVPGNIDNPDKDDNGDKPGTDDKLPAVKAQYSQQYRPQVHYTPAKNWINDPNGMVLVDGVWHLFYQYNPKGNGWGNMSWGHATSKDLMHWEEQSVALVRDNLGDIFSGSAVVDKDNTAGFGAGAVIALYTSAGEHQQQSMAYSTDGAKSFKTYNGNPIIANTDKGDFRDPKVFWHEQSQQWVMSLARGWTYQIDFYVSKDLKSWEYLSSFNTPGYARCNAGQWECPDLFCLKDAAGKEKWVLIVSTNPGGPLRGSGTMYFVGDFDGKTFTADSHDYPLWLDYGMDNYAGVTWSNTGDRKVFIGWMNNWDYSGDVPCDPWRSAMTLPRELTLANVGGYYYLSCKVAKEIDAIAGNWTDISGTMPKAYAYHVQLPLDLNSDHTVTLSNEAGQTYDITVKAGARTITARRNDKSGAVAFNGSFSQYNVRAFVPGTSKDLTLDIYIDQSSVEVVSADGLVNITNLVFPSSIYNNVSVDGEAKGRVRTLESVWLQ